MTIGPRTNLLRRLGRSLRVLALGVRIYLGYRRIALRQRVFRRRSVENELRRHHRWSAEQIYETATRLEGLLIKAAQVIGSRPDIIPDEYVAVLSRLQDTVPPKPLAAIEAQITAETGRPVSDTFAEFDARAVAAASKAQVHRARLKDGRAVAVKVLYPGIEQIIETDLRALRNIFRIANRLQRGLNFIPVWEEIARSVPLELDMRQEGQNAERIALNFRGRKDVVVPGIVWEHTTRRMLVMEYIEGVKVTDAEALQRAGIDPQEVAALVARLYCEQIFLHGAFHADPHPGNILVRPGPQVVLLDFGLCRYLSPEQRRRYADLVHAVLTRDTPRMLDGFQALGFKTAKADPGLFTTMAEAFISTRADDRSYLSRERVAEASLQVRQALRDNALLDLPGDFLFMMRVMGLLSGIGRALDGHHDALALLRHYSALGREEKAIVEEAGGVR